MIILSFPIPPFLGDPPPPHFYKANVEVACSINNTWGIGVVTRDSYGYDVIGCL